MHRAALLLMVLLAAGGCGVFDRLTGTDQRRTLTRQRDAWRALSIRDYGFDFQRSCFCSTEQTQPVHIEVRGNSIASVVNITTGDTVLLDDFPRWPTMDSLFVWAERGLDFGYALQISYDATFHFPWRVSGDLPRAIDDEYTETVVNFVQGTP
jgi:hypothetical protein